MGKPSAWIVGETKERGRYRFFSVSALEAIRASDGHPHTFYRIDCDDWVNVVALTADDEFVMVHQYRVGSASVTLEIPGGVIDPEESPRDAAARELLEETGYAPEQLVEIGRISPNPALYSNRLYTYLALGCRKVADLANDEAEETVVELVPRADLPGRVASGEVGHALVLAALHWLSLYRGDVTIRAVRAHELEHILAIESAAGRKFASVGLPSDLGGLAETEVAQAQSEGLLWAATAPSDGSIVGFGLAWQRADALHLREVDVLPSHAGRGIGRRLVEHACALARQRRLSRLTLTTFRDVPWNAPWYRRLGFTEVADCEAPGWLTQIRRDEDAHGLGHWPRVIMQRELLA